MKKDIKKHMLKMLKKSMKDMMFEDKGEFMDEMPKSEKMTKVTVMGDSPEAVEKGLTKAQEIMKAKLGEASVGSEELEKKKEIKRNNN